MIDPQNSLTTSAESLYSGFLRPYGGLIIDGVTGSGKSTILSLLPKIFQQEPTWSCNGIFPEEETCGEFWEELRIAPNSSDAYKTRMLANVVAQLEQAKNADPEYHFVLERAHYSLFAALPEWRLYEGFDQRLALLRPVTILLDISEDLIGERCIHHEVRPQAEGLLELYGSETKAVQALAATQQKRKEALTLSRIPYHIIDTSVGAWPQYAERIKSIVSGRNVS